MWSNENIRYQFFGKSLKVVNKSKDLGILMSSDLKWGDHVNATVNKANQILGVIKRTVGCSNAAVFPKLYTSLFRPVLEYATPVWSPYLVKDIEALENVQRRASRLALKQKRGEMSYQEHCKFLKQYLTWTVYHLTKSLNTNSQTKLE